MDQILAAWLNLVEDLEVLVDALDKGIDGLVHALGEYADSAIQSLVPAYATAVAACNQIKVPGTFDCNAERIKLRDFALRELIHALGLDPILQAILNTYRKIPKALKDIILHGAQAVGAAVDLFKDPSWTHLKEFSTALIKAVGSYFGPFINLAMKGLSGLKAVGEWLADIGSNAAAAIAKLFSEAGKFLAHVGTDILNAGVEFIGDAEHLIAGFVGDAGSAVSGLIADAGGALADAASGAIEATGDAVEDAVEWTGDAVASLNPF
jgi:hypothetical protein